MTLSMVTVSWSAPVPIVSWSPAARPFVLCSRIAVAPAEAGWFSVVLAAGRGVADTFPAASKAR